MCELLYQVILSEYDNFCIIPHLQVFNKGAHYSLIALSVWFWFSKHPKTCSLTITYSWMRHAVSDKNVKKAGRQQHINARL